MQVGAIALEEFVTGQRQENIEIARRTAADPGLAFAGEANAGAVFDALRNVDREGAVARHPSRTDTGGTGVFDHLAAALTTRTGAFQRKEALSLPYPPLSATGRAGLRLGAGLGAGA